MNESYDLIVIGAGWQALLAVRNALVPGASKGVTDHVPWTMFTDPAVAWG